MVLFFLSIVSFKSAEVPLAQLPPVFHPSVPSPKSTQVVWPRIGDRVVSATADLGYIIGEKLGEGNVERVCDFVMHKADSLLGSFGAVYKCIDDFGQRFVIKILKAQK